MELQDIVREENKVYSRPALLNDTTMHYCPGCSHSLVHKVVAELIDEMQDEADTMAFEEHAFMKEELEKHLEEPYKFEMHQQQFERTKMKINEGTEILAETNHLERRKDELIKEREKRGSSSS